MKVNNCDKGSVQVNEEDINSLVAGDKNFNKIETEERVDDRNKIEVEGGSISNTSKEFNNYILSVKKSWDNCSVEGNEKDTNNIVADEK